MLVFRADEYSTWIDNLKDRAGRALVLMRVDRLIHGNSGSRRNLKEGVSELKKDVGPGYRVYYSLRGDSLLLLLAGGSKSSLSHDVTRALELNRLFGDQLQ